MPAFHLLQLVVDAQNGRVVADDFVRQRRIVVQLDAVTGHQFFQTADHDSA